MINKGDKVIWIWLTLKGGMELRNKGTRISPPALHRLWAWVFELQANGSYVRGERALAALRLRSKAYRLSGMPAEHCSHCAQSDLFDAITQNAV